MSKPIEEIWYEVAFSYYDEYGTETFDTAETLTEAQLIVDDIFVYEDLTNVEFIFIDKWYVEKGGLSVKDKNFEPIIYDKDEAEVIE